MDMRTAHDFSTENTIFFILSGFITVKSPPCYFIICVIYRALQLGLYAFLLTMEVYTMYIAQDDKVLAVRGFHSFCLTLFTGFISLQSLTDKSVNEASNIIKAGIFKYANDDPTELDELLALRVSQISQANNAFNKLMVSCGMMFVFLYPLIQKFTVQDSAESLINPYLPLPLYMPFNTKTYLGYLLAFILIGASIILLFLSAFCAIAIYTSFAVQLIAHIEVLNMSLLDIERRAASKIMDKDLLKNQNISEYLYEKIEFQNSLYSCLRENILHHHAILRFKKAISPFLEMLNGVTLFFFSATMAASLALILEGSNSDLSIAAFLFAEVVSYLLICLIGQIITDKSSETDQYLYGMPWPHCDEKVKLLMKNMATYLAKPITLKITGFGAVSSLETFGDMIAMGYKLTSVLR